MKVVGGPDRTAYVITCGPSEGAGGTDKLMKYTAWVWVKLGLINLQRKFRECWTGVKKEREREIVRIIW